MVPTVASSTVAGNFVRGHADLLQQATERREFYVVKTGNIDEYVKAVQFSPGIQTRDFSM
jgi:hypothetical protein